MKKANKFLALVLACLIMTSILSGGGNKTDSNDRVSKAIQHLLRFRKG